MLAQISCVAEADSFDELLDRRRWADLVYTPVFAVVQISNLDGYIRHLLIGFIFVSLKAPFLCGRVESGKERANRAVRFRLIMNRYVDDSLFFSA